ncbi:hypothetical protein IEQ34_001699 [Dendrobium chrysotoxum]|uniref:Uncharacterized protein n=1 Tax=Dendrobium chrysotoxum TaxID=161865 RepID=A0AAV7HMD4_DENCH|nr:hypothetical protein IEQ34_001699 [Dendrobium chrysotoxum]
MGINMSLFQSFGLTGIKSLTADKVFDKYFPSTEIHNFKEFHINFLKLCSDFNSVLLGKHYKPPSNREIEDCFTLWSKLEGTGEKDQARRKELVLNLLTKNVKEIQTGNTIIMTGLVVPPTLMVLKKSSQNVPQLKRFRLDLVPDVAFVPTFTIAALIAVKALQLKQGNKTK